jgi:uncharacterized membrane protein
MKKVLTISLFTISITILFTWFLGKDPVTYIKDSSFVVQLVSVVFSIITMAIIIIFDLKQKHQNKIK